MGYGCKKRLTKITEIGRGSSNVFFLKLKHYVMLFTLVVSGTGTTKGTRLGREKNKTRSSLHWRVSALLFHISPLILLKFSHIPKSSAFSFTPLYHPPGSTVG